MLKKIRSVAIYVVGSLLPVMATNALAIETGVASYYSDKFQGRKTASGDRYDRNKLTAAHRTLPIGSQIEVTNLKNQNSVIVTINDRGPYSSHRKLDLSYAAAKELGLVAMGTAPVSFDVVSPEKNADFEKVIPLEYSPGVMQVAKSEEEVIEAEEELADAETTADTKPTSDVEKSIKNSHEHRHKAKRLAVKSRKLTPAEISDSKNHHAAQSEKTVKSKKTSKSDNSDLKQSSKSKKVVKADKNTAKKATKSKKTKTSH